METARTVKDVSPHDFVRAYAGHLKRSGKIELPPWTDIVKTGVHKELAPYDSDWYFVRAASMARQIYLRQGLGVGAFQRIYGGRKRNGSCPPHFSKSSGSIARHILQQLQHVGIIDIDAKGFGPPVLGSILTGYCVGMIMPMAVDNEGLHNFLLHQDFYRFLALRSAIIGRRITSQGQRDLDQVAGRIVVAP